MRSMFKKFLVIFEIVIDDATRRLLNENYK